MAGNKKGDAAAGTNPNANPVILDALGSANIWLANVAYKIVLQDPLGSVVWTADNINQSGVAADAKTILQVAQETPLINAADSVSVFWGLATQVPTVAVDAKAEFTTANARFTAKANGIYKITLSMQMFTMGATIRAGFTPTLGFVQNGVVVQQRLLGAPSANVPAMIVWGLCIVVLTAGDYLRGFTNVGWSAGTTPTFGYNMTVNQL